MDIDMKAIALYLYPEYNDHCIPKDILFIVFGYLCHTEIYYYKSGKIKSETPYVNEEKHGTEIYYYKSGEIKHQNTYENGVKID